MASFLAHIKVRPGTESDFEAVARHLHQRTHAHEHEDNVVRYEYWRGQETGTFYTLASFRDADAFIDHQVSQHHVELAPEIMGMVEEFRLEWIEPIDGLAPAPRTEPTNSVSSYDELRNSYHDRFPIHVGQWWTQLRA